MNTLVSGVEQLLAARSMQELHIGLASMANQLGFHSWAAVAIEDRGSSSQTVHVLDQIPLEYERFMSEAAGATDPVMQRCKRSSEPFIWNQDAYTRAGMGTLWEEMAGVGMREGAIATLHMPRGRHFLLGFDGDDVIKPGSVRHFETLATVQLAMVHAEAAFERFVWGATLEVTNDERHGLTPRELECLRWTAEGKTAWEVGVILSITERTANKHLDAAATKLGCANKLQAVARALRTRLIA